MSRLQSLVGLAGLFSLCLCADQLAAQTERADSAFDAEDRVLAERLYVEVLAEDPWNSRATYQLAVLRRDRPADALRLFRRYTELEPDALWGFLALAGQLDRMGRTDDALAALGPAQELDPDETDLLTLRGRLQMRAGRYPEALESYSAVAANRSSVDATVARRIAWLEGETSPALLPGALVSRDTDSNVVTRTEIGGDAALGGRARLGVSVGRTTVSDGVSSHSTVSPSVFIAWRPRADLRVQGEVGGSRIQAGTEPVSFPMEGDLRLRWRWSGGRGGLEVRAQRLLLAVSPGLLATEAVRSEGRTRVDIPLVGPLGFRAGGRLGRYTTTLDSNQRTMVHAGPVLHVLPAGEVSIQIHDQRFDKETLSPYFAPRKAQVTEVATYVELEGSGLWLFILDGGVGAQRVAGHGAAFSGWEPTFRADISATYAFRGGRSLRLGLEAYDSRIGNVVTGTSASWRYVAASTGLQWSLR
jgi:Flp pilus assembly protein TadD